MVHPEATPRSSVAPRIHGLCVCVDYSHYLAVSGTAWIRGLTTLTVVTTPRDRRTALVALAVASHHIPATSLRLHTTDVFYAQGAAFNKGAAMEEARRSMPWEDWILLFDVDIVPEMGWRGQIAQSLEPGYLYGAPRLQAPLMRDIGNPVLPPVPDDRVGYGYFQLFHAGDPRVQRTPLLDTHWRHAGNADSNFLLSFGEAVRTLPLILWHIGPAHENWFGVGQEEAFKQMQERRGGRGIHPSERLD